MLGSESRVGRDPLELSLEALLSQGQGEKDSWSSTLPPCGAGAEATMGKERDVNGQGPAP